MARSFRNGSADMDAVAVIGMAGRFPHAKTLEQFWLNIRNGIECISTFSQSELLRSGVAKSELADQRYVGAEAVLDDIDLFDASFFGFTPREAATMNPQHRLFLECASDALEDAGCASDRFDERV